MCVELLLYRTLDSKKILLNGLSQLNNEGRYAGVALAWRTPTSCLVRRTGKVATYGDNGTDYRCLPLRPGPYEIGDPRRSDDSEHHPIRPKVTLVHNGIIENYHQLTEQFHLQGRLHLRRTAKWLPGCSQLSRETRWRPSPSCRLN